MKPNFALILSSDSVRLVHRTDAGWAPVGDVALDLPNGEAALVQLRERAHSLPGDHSCKLVLPDDQIKYLTLETEGDPDEAVRAALHGATPYAVDDLEYDWIADDGVIHVAAVALETLAEAERFALQHGFEPVCFAAIPTSADFRGEPFFGVTEWAVNTLPDGTNVERDDAPIRVTGDTSAQPAISDATSKAAPVTAPNKPPSAPPVSIRASRSGDASAAVGAPLVAAPPPPHSTIKTQVISATPPLPSPTSDDMSDKPRLDELSASLRPDPKARLDRDPIAKVEGSPAKTAAPLPKKAEKQRLTIFGARKDGMRGKPRFLGLILTAILLLFLIGVAALASAVLDDGLARFFGRGDDFKLANVPISQESTAEQSAPTLFDDAQDERREILPLPVAASARSTALPKNASPTRQVAALPDHSAPLSPNEVTASYAATGIWQMAPTPPEAPAAGVPLVDLYRVSLDSSIAFGAPANLPRRTAEARDTAPQAPGKPPAAGTRFDFDARGLVRATSQGTLTPEGIHVFAHRPPQTPPANMAQTGAIPAKASPELTETSGAQAGEIAPLSGDPSLANLRPRARSISALTDAAAEQAPEMSATAPQSGNATRPPSGSKPHDPSSANSTSTASAAAFIGDPSLAGLRPRTRPGAVSAIAATLQSASGAALGSAAAVVINDPEELDDTFENATEQAVSASLTPLRRPSDFKTIINRTREPAAEQPLAPAQPVQPAAKAQPVLPTQKMQPSLPSSVSVSNQATDKKVLNLRQVNLIGVYGSTASRRALVRLSNGRFQKVSVGDSLDGGQVAAIGESELHYIKRGRQHVLRMPQS